MEPTFNISYLRNGEINKEKWNRCIDHAEHGLIYAQSSYLDKMALNWDALVLNDYEAVMPLTWKRKYSFYYLYQPYFIPALGVMGLTRDDVKVTDFLQAIPGRYRYWDIKLNETNKLSQLSGSLGCDITIRSNYLLNLSENYEAITAGYKRLCHRMIKKAVANKIRIDNSGSAEDVIRFYQKFYDQQHPAISADVYDALIETAKLYYGNGNAKVYLAKNPSGTLIAAYLVLVDKNSVYSLIGGSSPEGKDTGAFYLLTDAAIKEHAGTARTFRFEGSDIEGIAFFNKQFNPEAVHYCRLVKNNLPFPLRLLK